MAYGLWFKALENHAAFFSGSAAFLGCSVSFLGFSASFLTGSASFLRRSVVNDGWRSVLHVIQKDYDYAFKRVKYPGVPDLSLIPVHDDPFMVQHVQVMPIHVQHLTLRILGYRIGTLGYITDANFIAEKELAKLTGLDVLVINALRIEPHYSHFNLEQALAIINRLQPKQAYLTHISHSLGKYADVAPTLPENVFLGYDGLSVEW